LYPAMRPIFPQRWAPVGANASFLVTNKTCNDCHNSTNCHCLNEITPEQVYDVMKRWQHKSQPNETTA
jgi:heptosyltransferase III